MVKHIVVYTLKEGVDKDAAVALIASKLEPLVGQIPGLRHMEVRRCYAGVDYALYSEFDTAEDVKYTVLENVKKNKSNVKNSYFYLNELKIVSQLF